jgi:hypothetical protein
MMILYAVRSISLDVPGIYQGMVTQTRRQKQKNPHHSYGSSQSTMAIDTALTLIVVQLEKKSCITSDDDHLCCENAFS